MLVPTDAELGCGPPPNQKTVTFIPSFEFFELEAFIALIDSLLKSPSLPEKDKIRLLLTGYCRIMESDLPLAIVWNLLRAASGNPEAWTFTRVSKAGDTLTCEYPREKIEEIYGLSKKPVHEDRRCARSALGPLCPKRCESFTVFPERRQIFTVRRALPDLAKARTEPWSKGALHDL